MMKKQVWFKINNLQMKAGTIIDGWYDGLLQVKEDETGQIYIVAPDEMEPIADDRTSWRSHEYECGNY
jgi:hypothetical protein